MAISAGTLGVVPAAPAPPAREGLAAGTRVLLEAPIPGTLLRLAAPNVVVIAVQAAINVLEAVYVGWLGRDALAGIALVFPLVMLMQTMSAGGMGVGIASAIARALGGGRRRDADALVVHALAIALVLGAAFTVGMLWGGPRLYRAMGGTDGALAAALTYSNVVFAGAGAFWLFNTLGSVLRGAGNMRLPAVVVVGGGPLLVVLSPALIWGWGPLPRLGIAGPGVGAGELARARRIALVGGAMAFALTETIGLAAALFPGVWMSLFTRDPAVVAAGSAYLRVVGPSYGFFGLGLALYFASQGAGRVVWPVVVGVM